MANLLFFFPVGVFEVVAVPEDPSGTVASGLDFIEVGISVGQTHQNVYNAPLITFNAHFLTFSKEEEEGGMR